MQKKVKRAVVLAAGFGTRLKPLTVSRPKPLLPVMGEPMLARILDMLVSWGVDEIIVNAHHLADQVKEFVSEYKGEAKITVAEEKEILGTGGVLKPIAAQLGEDPFWLVNGDIVVDSLDPEPIEEAFGRSGNFAACWISENYGPRTIEADPEGRICNWKSEDAGCPGTYTYCGVALLSPQIIRYLPPDNFCSIVSAYENAMMTDAKFVIGVDEEEAAWCDAGTLDSYRELNSEPMQPSLFGEKRLDALVSALGWKDGDTLAEYLGARGSDRMMWRLTGGDASALAVVYEETRKENANARYVPHTRHLAANHIPVPELLAEVVGSNAYAVKWVEGKSLEDVANAKGADIVKLYAPILSLLKKFRSLSLPEQTEPAFGPDLFKWERDLFARECVSGRYGIESLPPDVEAELVGIAEKLSAEPQVPVHRDFQSSNIIMSDQGPVTIDFQGLRGGPAAYDAASLIYDPYVGIDSADRKLLSELADVPLLPQAAVQRLCQALGAYCRLASAGQTRFLGYILRALGNLHEAVHLAELPAMAAFVHELIEREGFRNGGSGHHHHHCH